MKNLKSLFNIIFLFICASTWAQQETVITNYWSHMNLVNPAYVGSDENIYFTSTLRSQWTGITDAPETQMMSISAPFPKNVGFGMSVVNDKTFVEQNTYVAFDFSYKLKVSEKSDLYFGLKAGANFYSVDVSNLDTYSLIQDPSLVNVDDSYPNVGIGLLLKHEKWYLSLSVPRVLNTERVSVDEGRATMATDRPHFYASTGYNFDLKSKWVLTPSVFLRYVENAPISFDTNLLVTYNDIISAGVTYRNEKTYAAILMFDISKNIELGYAYESSSRDLLSREWNSNELVIRFKLKPKPKVDVEELQIDE